jgi:hypothetical protein
MAAQQGQRFDIELSGVSIRYREYTSGGTAQWNYYPVANIKAVESVVQIGFGTRDTTNLRKNPTRQDDLLCITINFTDDTKPLVFDIQNVMNQAGWTANAAGVTQALTDINGWIGTGGGGLPAGAATSANQTTEIAALQDIIDQGTGVIDTTFSSPALPYTVPAGVNSYSITTQGSVAVDGITVPSGTPFSASHPSQDGTVLSPAFTDVAAGSLFVTLGIKI